MLLSSFALALVGMGISTFGVIAISSIGSKLAYNDWDWDPSWSKHETQGKAILTAIAASLIIFGIVIFLV